MDVEIIPQQVSDGDGTVDMVILRPLEALFVSKLQMLEEVYLSPQQQAVLHHMTTGLTYKEIARKMQISLPTVHYHKQEIFEKLQVDTRVEAVTWVLQVNSEK